MSNLNWVDYFFVAIFLVSVLTGFLRGFIGEVIALITLIAAFVIAILFSNALAAYFTDTAVVQSAVNQASTAIGMSASQPVSYIALGISFALIFVAVIIIGAIVRGINDCRVGQNAFYIPSCLNHFWWACKKRFAHLTS